MECRQRRASRGRLRSRVREHGQDEALRVPERVPVVAGAGEALCRDRALLGPGARLERVEEREAHGLLELRVAVELDVGALPERRRGTRAVRPPAPPSRCAVLRPAWPRPRRGARVASAGSTRRRRGTSRPAGARPAARSAATVTRAEVGPALCRGLRAGRSLDDVIHARGHPELAAPGRVDEHRAACMVEELLGARAATRAPRRRGDRRARAGAGSLATSSDWTTTRTGPSSGSTS